jgi:hypothetical protein
MAPNPNNEDVIILLNVDGRDAPRPAELVFELIFPMVPHFIFAEGPVLFLRKVELLAPRQRLGLADEILTER